MRRAHIRTAILLAAMVGLLALFFRNAHFEQVLVEIRSANLIDLLFSVLLTIATYVLRAVRWRYLLEPIGPTRFRTALRTTVIGFAASFLLPARAGEVLRPYLLSRQEGLSATSTFATIVIERLLDLVTVLLLFGIFLLGYSPESSVDPATFATVRLGGIAAGVGAVIALVMVFVVAGFPELIGRTATGLERVLPAKLAHAVARIAQRFAEGFAVMRHPRALLMAFLTSIPLWLSIALGIWLVTRAFHMTIPFMGSFLVMTILVVGVAVPTPGAVGGFHEAFRLATTAFYAVPNDRAVGAAIVLHAISFLPVTLAGVLFMAQDGLNLGGLKSLAESSPPEPAPAPVGTDANVGSEGSR